MYILYSKTTHIYVLNCYWDYSGYLHEQHDTGKFYDQVKHLLFYMHTHIHTNVLKKGISSQALNSCEYFWSYGEKTSESLHTSLGIYITC